MGQIVLHVSPSRDIEDFINITERMARGANLAGEPPNLRCMSIKAGYGVQVVGNLGEGGDPNKGDSIAFIPNFQLFNRLVLIYHVFFLVCLLFSPHSILSA